MSPTMTARLPPVIAWACGEWMSIMSHCSAENVSASVAGAFGSSAGWSSWLSVSTGATCEPNPDVPETPSMRLFCIRSVRNDGSNERAITTPMLLYAATMVPPAPLIVLAASAGTACCL
jgi:hypothetical protein